MFGHPGAVYFAEMMFNVAHQSFTRSRAHAFLYTPMSPPSLRAELLHVRKLHIIISMQQTHSQAGYIGLHGSMIRL